MIWLFFGFSGRISRAAFLLAGLLMMIAVVFIVYRMTLAQDSGADAGLWEALLSAVLFASLWAQAALGAKRMHDLGRPGIFAALLFVPLFNFIAFIGLCLLPGEAGANKYAATTNAPS